MRIPAPNFTQAPNVFFDDIAKTLKEGELRVLLVIMRQTFGWHKQWDRISLSQLERKTGMCRDAVSNAIKSLIEKNLIEKRKVGDPGKEKCFYTLISEEPEKDEEFEDDGDESIDDSNSFYQSSKTTPTSRFRRPTKETPTKETKEDSHSLVQETSPLAPRRAERKSKKDLPKEAEELSKYLFEAIRKIKPDFKAPNFVTWAKDMELLLRVDGKKEDEIKRVIEWLPTSWWIKNVLSTAKLRKHFERLQIEMMKLDQKPGVKPLAMQARKPTKEEIEEWNKNDPFAKELERQKQAAMKAQPSPTASSQQTTSQKSSSGVEKVEDS